MANKIGKLWAVTEGAYSDFHIVALFEREEDAEAAMRRGLGDDVGEYPYCPAGVLPRQVMQHRVYARAVRNGKLADAEVRVESSTVWDLDNAAPRRPRIEERSFKLWSQDAVGLSAVCANAELAEKAVRDRLARIYAEWSEVA